MLNFRINKLLFVLCLLLSLNAFAQKNDSLDVQNEDPVALLDSIDHYQNLIDETESKIENKSWGYLGLGLGSVSLVSGLYLLHSIAGAGGAGYAIGAGVIPAVLIFGGLGLTIAGAAALSTTSKLPEQVAEYKERKAFFSERYDEIKLSYVQDTSSVNLAYIELLNDDTFKSLGSIGRSDLFGGDGRALVNGIKSKILTLPGNTVVLPGHGPLTTVADEKLWF